MQRKGVLNISQHSTGWQLAGRSLHVKANDQLIQPCSVFAAPWLVLTHWSVGPAAFSSHWMTADRWRQCSSDTRHVFQADDSVMAPLPVEGNRGETRWCYVYNIVSKDLAIEGRNSTLDKQTEARFKQRGSYENKQRPSAVVLLITWDIRIS